MSAERPVEVARMHRMLEAIPNGNPDNRCPMELALLYAQSNDIEFEAAWWSMFSDVTALGDLAQEIEIPSSRTLAAASAADLRRILRPDAMAATFRTFLDANSAELRTVGQTLLAFDALTFDREQAASSIDQAMSMVEHLNSLLAEDTELTEMARTLLRAQLSQFGSAVMDFRATGLHQDRRRVRTLYGTLVLTLEPLENESKGVYDKVWGVVKRFGPRVGAAVSLGSDGATLVGLLGKAGQLMIGER